MGNNIAKPSPTLLLVKRLSMRRYTFFPMLLTNDPLASEEESTSQFHICVLESLISNKEGRKSVLQCLAKRDDIHLVHFITAVNAYEERFESGEESAQESLAELEKFVSRIVDLYLMNRASGEYRTSKLREEIIDFILDGEFDYLYIAKEDALMALLRNTQVRRLVSKPRVSILHGEHV